MKNRYLFFIIFFGFLIRVILLGRFPVSLNWDEVSHGYNAYSILQTGKDEWGKSFPSIFRAYGDYKLPIYIYSTAVSIFIFGMNEFSVRLPSALAGTAFMGFTYLLAEHLFKNKRIAILASFLACVEPWSLFMSRVALEANLSLAFTVGAVYFLLTGLEKENYRVLVSALLFGVSLWTYNSARIFIPTLIVGILLIYSKNFYKFSFKSRGIAFLSVVSFTFFFSPMIIQLLSIEGSARYSNLQIIDEGAIAQINYMRNNSGLPGVLPILLHNKIVFFTQEFLLNYINHFHPYYLFIGGGDHYQFSIPAHGLLYALNLPFVFWGFVLLARSSFKNKNYLIILIWIGLAPLASSITRDSPHVLRSSVLLPIPMILTSVGLVNLIKKRWQWVAYFIISAFFILRYFYLYQHEYSRDYSWVWQYGYKEAVLFAQQNYNQYDKIIFTKKYGEPHEFVLFYNKWDPDKYRQDKNLVRFNQSNWWWVDSFDKYYFANDWQIKDLILESGSKINCDKDCLLISSPDNYPEGWTKLKTINFLDGKTAFEIYEN